MRSNNWVKMSELFTTDVAIMGQNEWMSHPESRRLVLLNIDIGSNLEAYCIQNGWEICKDQLVTKSVYRGLFGND